MYKKLKYDKFEKYLYEATKETLSHKENYQYIFKFDNGYGASVIKNSVSHGHAQDLFELVVIKFTDEFTWNFCYTTKITDAVLGYLENDDVLGLLERIKNL